MVRLSKYNQNGIAQLLPVLVLTALLVGLFVSLNVLKKNQDTAAHQVASDPHPSHTGLSGFESDPLNANDTYSFTFEKPGTFTYHDHLNPTKLKGSVIVQ